MITSRRKWKEKFPRLVNLLACQLGQDFFIWGTTIDELTYDFLKHEYMPDDIISEINQIISLMKEGEINPDQFLEDLREETIPKYDHLSTLEYFETIRDSLEKNKKIMYGK